MSTLVTESGRFTTEISQMIAAEIRGEMGRRGISQRRLADQIGMHQSRLSARIGMNATVELAFTDVVAIAAALGADLLGLLEPLNRRVLAGDFGESYLMELRARRDSNPKPSDLVFGAIAETVNRRLTLDRRYREAWGLAA